MSDNLKCVDRNGNVIITDKGQEKTIRFLYDTSFGKLLLKLLVKPFISKLGGFFMNRRISCFFINRFVKNHNIDMSEYISKKYVSYNDFFTRKINPEKRPCDYSPEKLIAPCDGNLSVFRIDEYSKYEIKGSYYTVSELLGGNKKSAEFNGGTLLIFRLTTDNYHRYSYFDSGEKSSNTFIKGVFHTVNPIAYETHRIHKENSREYCFIKTDNFGLTSVIEVGALMVGRIVNLDGEKRIERGDEKGYFEFGGSTIVICFKKDKVMIDSDITENSAKGIETAVNMFEVIGRKANC